MIEQKKLKLNSESSFANQLTPMELASRNQRSFNLLIDTIFLSILAFIFRLIWRHDFNFIINIKNILIELPSLIIGLIPNKVQEFIYYEFDISLLRLADKIIQYLPIFFLFLIYFVFPEKFSGKTLGKLITGTKAESEDGAKLTFGQALVRTLCRFIPFEIFSFFGGNGRPIGLHDKIPKTKVISVK